MTLASYNRRWLVVLAGIFFISGFSALLYQVVWQRMLGLFSGSDVRSVTIVTGAYLAGLGIGSLIGSFYADRLNNRQAVQAFGLCNVGIAIFAFLSRFFFYDLLFRELNTLARRPLLMLLIIFVSLLWPTTLMGLSLPLLAKALVQTISNAAGLISLLYGLNTFGAGVGTLVAGWYLIGTLGYEYTVYVGGFLTILVGLIALFVARQFKSGERPQATVKSPGLNLGRIPGHIWEWCLLVFISGFIAISLELIWFRVLDVLLQSNAYTFGHFLAFILIGYSVGSLYGAHGVKRINNPRRVFLWIQGLVVLYSILVIWGIALMMRQGWLEPYFAAFAQDRGRIMLNSLAENWFNYSLGYLLLPAIMLLPPNLLIGFYFPVTQKAVQTDGHLVGQRVGLIQVSNIIGNTLGSILTGLVLLHFWGTAGALRLIGVLGLFLTLVLIREGFWGKGQPGKSTGRRSQLISGALALGLLIMLVIFPGTTQLWSWLHQVKINQLFIVAEDSSGVTALQRFENGDAIVYINGQTQGAIPYQGLHSLLGSAAGLVHPDPKRILVIGIGSGGTPYSAGVSPQTEQVLAVEIVGSLLPVLKAYAQESQGFPLQAFFNDGCCQILIGDGRRELTLNNTTFDVIEADAILPWRSHSGFLYSKEFFEEARAKLAEGGIMVQWRPTSRIETTFVDVFPYGINFSDVILIGSNQPLSIDRQALLARAEEPAFVDYWERGGIDPNVVWGAIASSELSSWTPESPRNRTDINTDLFPKDEYYLNNN